MLEESLLCRGHGLAGGGVARVNDIEIQRATRHHQALGCEAHQF